MLAFFLLRSILATPKSPIQSTYIGEFSLIPPHVGPNGKEDFFVFQNECMVKTGTRRDFTQLGYKSPSSFAAVVSKNTLKNRDFEINFDFTIQDISRGGPGAGFGFWLTESVQNKREFYGRNRDFNGFGVVIDIENSPNVRFVDNSTTKKTSVPIKNLGSDEPCTISFMRSNGNLLAKFIANGKESVLFSGTAKLPRSFVLGVTSFSGSSSATLNLERIISNSLRPSAKRQHKKGERSSKMNGFILFVGFCSILGLAYYLYQKQPKDFVLKN